MLFYFFSALMSRKPLLHQCLSNVSSFLRTTWKVLDKNVKDRRFVSLIILPHISPSAAPGLEIDVFVAFNLILLFLSLLLILIIPFGFLVSRVEELNFQKFLMLFLNVGFKGGLISDVGFGMCLFSDIRSRIDNSRVSLYFCDFTSA